MHVTCDVNYDLAISFENTYSKSGMIPNTIIKKMNRSSVVSDCIDEVLMERTLCREDEIHKTFVNGASLT